MINNNTETKLNARLYNKILKVFTAQVLFATEQFYCFGGVKNFII